MDGETHDGRATIWGAGGGGGGVVTAGEAGFSQAPENGCSHGMRQPVPVAEMPVRIVGRVAAAVLGTEQQRGR